MRAASFLHRSPRVRLAALLAAPMVWLVVAYLGSLAVMFAAAFWSTDSFTGALIKQFSWDNFRTLRRASRCTGGSRCGPSASRRR